MVGGGEEGDGVEEGRGGMTARMICCEGQRFSEREERKREQSAP